MSFWNEWIFTTEEQAQRQLWEIIDDTKNPYLQGIGVRADSRIVTWYVMSTGCVHYAVDTEWEG